MYAMDLLGTCSALKISRIRHREARKRPIKEEVKVEIKRLSIFPSKKILETLFKR